MELRVIGLKYFIGNKTFSEVHLCFNYKLNNGVSIVRIQIWRENDYDHECIKEYFNYIPKLDVNSYRIYEDSSNMISKEEEDVLLSFPITYETHVDCYSYNKSSHGPFGGVLWGEENRVYDEFDIKERIVSWGMLGFQGYFEYGDGEDGEGIYI